MNIEVDVSELGNFADVCEAAGRALQDDFQTFLEALGEEFLRIVADEIVANKIVITRTLLQSFVRGNENNFWKLQEGGLTLEIGSNVEYAKWVNDGHFQDRRFVPGVWDGDVFRYQRGASTGMMLTAKYVEGCHYWEHSLKILERIMPQMLDRLIQDWLNSYFE